MIRNKAFYRTFFALCLPIVLQNMISLSVNLADNLMLGRYAEASLSGVTAANQIQFVYQQIIFGCSEGMMVLASQYFGMGETKEMKRVAGVAMWTAIAFMCGLFMVVSIIPEQMIGIFTKDSVGVALCEKYHLSKGQSLSSFLNEADESLVIKLIVDLFEHYEFRYDDEISSTDRYAKLYQKCKPIYERIKTLNNTQIAGIDNIKEKFSSEYISSQIDLMINMQSDNPTDAIGKAKELIESCCQTILEQKSIDINKNWDINKLVDETFKYLRITPNDIPEDIPDAKSIKSILGNLKAIAGNVASLRNNYGSGHGKSASFKGLQERHAKLAIGSSITLVNFIWDTFDRRQI